MGGDGPEPHEAHLKSHIKGAIFFDMHLCKDQTSPFPFMMPSQAYFIQIMKALDIRKSHTVVVYETGQGWFANRAAFMFRAMGHPNVKILDGQFAKWTKEGKEVVASDAAANDFEYTYNGENVHNYEDIEKIVKEGNKTPIIDTRPAPGFAGGNIPGSANLPISNYFAEDGTLKSADDLKAVFADAKIDLTQPVVHTCGGGIMATVGRAAALKAGATGAQIVYDGSWSEYSKKSAA